MENTNGLHTETGAERASRTASKLTESAASPPVGVDSASRTEAQDRFSTATSKGAQASAGEKSESATDVLREKVPSGTVAAAAITVANQLKRARTYLRKQGLTGIIDDLGSLIRRYPVQSLLIGVGLGYFLARIREK